ncbi:hypothetical protein A33Q_3979 [Indibacter alkaliphilus LW1]|uniref:TonB C-terminal domain-containing protein n=1 Tax=Indibacter alkaliphilus (strain CCUG 57479 / KCTC 22604 / LW1) TaxID=1189612 RepID=S2DRX2_INDAL|nr:hypothetical protein [Indibacter alkaliphilus]EOZ92598.1 hypothetical protein A33Q_3979 [Indibacter alkaliphilus LW1]
MKGIKVFFLLILFFNFGLNLKGETVAFTASGPYSDLKEKEDERNSTLHPVLISEDNFGSAWEFPAHTIDIIDSYSSFIFRTKKSAAIDELHVVLNLNAKGKLVGFEILNEEADKGLRERLAYVLRQIPRAVLVSGYENPEATDFRLTIK